MDRTKLMDVLSKVLELIKFKGVVYRKFEAAAPWGIELPKSRFLQFWKLLEGPCWLQIEERVSIEMAKGDLVLIPNGSKHSISHKSDSMKIPLKTYIDFRDTPNAYFLDGNSKTKMLGGHFEFDDQYEHPLITHLPDLLYLKALHENEQDWVELTTDQILIEIKQPNAGSDIMVNRLSEALFIHLIRACLERKVIDHGFLSALTDQRISTALQYIQNFPKRNWTMAELAKFSGMSRTQFFNTFKSLVGQTPLTYLQNWRMQQAKEMLLKSQLKVSVIANQVGYGSEAAFNRLFKKKFSVTPASFRRSKTLKNTATSM
ncbi:AraC family transcriptional regulator [Mucilaginibacter lacusdianchii]|uniref:AraC family transcriptional regulator n=1 Tax=Mucilaginibacter lacusdianchii TaxID=2684211 RepID=UPI00131B75F8|nr:AraC family transcriptional regulator [Mucilaginibacter sp. JXJ CY 39]